MVYMSSERVNKVTWTSIVLLFLDVFLWMFEGLPTQQPLGVGLPHGYYNTGEIKCERVIIVYTREDEWNTLHVRSSVL